MAKILFVGGCADGTLGDIPDEHLRAVAKGRLWQVASMPKMSSIGRPKNYDYSPVTMLHSSYSICELHIVDDGDYSRDPNILRFAYDATITPSEALTVMMQSYQFTGGQK